MPRSTAKKAKPVVGACIFCNCADDNEFKWGKKITKNGITVHYFCMLFASGLSQNGEDDVGISGFMPKDIFKEINRGRRLKCGYCKKTGATIGCVNSICRMSFHYPCGVKHNVLYQYFGNFSSYCGDHRPKQNKAPGDAALPSKMPCAICMSLVESKPSNSTLRTPCCKSAWYHRDCIQRMAMASGMHFFKCPLCNNRDKFQEEMQFFGIHIPDQDAAWELEPNAFQELLERHSRCDVTKCLCPRGRGYHRSSGKYEIILCDYCGSQGCHLACGNLKTPADDWVCVECRTVVPMDKKKKAIITKQKKTTPDVIQLPSPISSGRQSDISNWLEKKVQSHYPGKTPVARQTTKRKHSDTQGGQAPKRSRTSSPRMSPQQGPSHSSAGASKVFSQSQSPKGSGRKEKSSTVQQMNQKTMQPVKKPPVARKSTTPRSTAVSKQYYDKGKENSAIKKSPGGLTGATGSSLPAQPVRRRSWRQRNSVDEEEEVLQLDFSNRPKWLQRLLEEDILTGANVGSKLSGFNMEPRPTADSRMESIQDSKKPKQPLWLRQTLMDNYVVGKNLGPRLAGLSQSVGRSGRSRSLGELNVQPVGSSQDNSPRKPVPGSCHKRGSSVSKWKRRARSLDTQDLSESSFSTRISSINKDKLFKTEQVDRSHSESRTSPSKVKRNLTYSEYLIEYKDYLERAAVAERVTSGTYVWRLHKYQEYLHFNNSQQEDIGTGLSNAPSSMEMGSNRNVSNSIYQDPLVGFRYKGSWSNDVIDLDNESSESDAPLASASDKEPCSSDSLKKGEEDTDDLVVVSASIIKPTTKLPCRCGKPHCAMSRMPRRSFGSAGDFIRPRIWDGKQVAGFRGPNMGNPLVCTCPKKSAGPTLKGVIDLTDEVVDLTEEQSWSELRQLQEKANESFLASNSPAKKSENNLPSSTPYIDLDDLYKSEESLSKVSTSKGPSAAVSPGKASVPPQNTPDSSRKNKLKLHRAEGLPRVLYSEKQSSTNNLYDQQLAFTSASVSSLQSPLVKREKSISPRKISASPKGLMNSPKLVSRSLVAPTNSHKIGSASPGWPKEPSRIGGFYGVDLTPHSWTSNKDYNARRETFGTPKARDTCHNSTSFNQGISQHSPAMHKEWGPIQQGPSHFQARQRLFTNMYEQQHCTVSDSGHKPGYEAVVGSNQLSRAMDSGDIYSPSINPQGMTAWSPSSGQQALDQGGATVTVRSPPNMDTQMCVNLTGESFQPSREGPGNVTINISMAQSQDQIINVD